jgi:hypothetical protein
MMADSKNPFTETPFQKGSPSSLLLLVISVFPYLQYHVIVAIHPSFVSTSHDVLCR